MVVVMVSCLRGNCDEWALSRMGFNSESFEGTV